MLEIAAMFAVGLVGGCLPMLVKWSERHLHIALALSTGILHGAVFLHLLPTLAALTPQDVHGAHEAIHASTGGASAHGAGLSLWFFVLLGVLAVYLVEALFLRTHDHDDLHRHRAVGYAALFGLSVHAFTMGLGFSAAMQHESLAMPVLFAILGHKGFEAFSVTTVFQLATFARRRILPLLVLFSLLTPAGVLIGDLFTGSLNEYGIGVVTALATGTFLYVCLCELLPEVFHHREDVAIKIALLGVGIGVMALFHGMGA